jgi:hypothetical protein
MTCDGYADPSNSEHGRRRELATSTGSSNVGAPASIGGPVQAYISKERRMAYSLRLLRRNTTTASRDARQMLLDEEVGRPRGWVATESDQKGDMDGRALSVLEVNVGPLMQAW